MDAEVDGRSALQRQARWLDDYSPDLRVSEQGRVLSVGDGIAWIDGLPSAAMDEVLQLEDGSRALVFHLKSDRLGAILLYQTDRLTAGTAVALTGRRLEMPVGEALLGRIVDPLGMPLDGQRELRFGQDPALLAGVRISVGPWMLQANLGEELSLFSAAASDGR